MKFKNTHSPEAQRAYELIQAWSAKLYTEAIFLGRQDDGKLKSDISLAHRIAPLTKSAHHIIAEVSLMMRPKLQKARGRLTLVHSRERERNLLDTQNETEKVLRMTPEGDVHLQSVILCVLWLALNISTYFAEIGFLTDSLQEITTSHNDAIKFAVGAATALMVVAHGGPASINQYVPTKLFRRLCRLLLFASVMGCFGYAGVLRNAYLVHMGQPSANPFVFAGINILFFSSTWLLFDLLLVPQLPKFWGSCKALYSRIKRSWIAQRFSSIKEQVTDHKETSSIALFGYIEQLDTVSIFRHLILNGYQQAVEAYKQAHRGQTGQSPPSFDDPIPDLDFSLLDPDDGELV